MHLCRATWHLEWALYRVGSLQKMAFAIYGGPRANKMAEVTLNLTKEAVSPETEAFGQFCELQLKLTF